MAVMVQNSHLRLTTCLQQFYVGAVGYQSLLAARARKLRAVDVEKAGDDFAKSIDENLTS